MTERGTLCGMNRKACPSDVADDEWAFVALYLTSMKRGRCGTSGGLPLYLASDEARWVTAQVLVVDAGTTATMLGRRSPSSRPSVVT